MKVREITKLLEQDGCIVRTKGSHKQKHSVKKGLVTVPGKPGDDVAVGTLLSIYKQSGIQR